MLVDGTRWQDVDAEFVAVGQPLVWDRKLPTTSDLAARCYDLRHVWRLQWEEYDGQDHPRHAAIHREPLDEFMRSIQEPYHVRAERLSRMASRYALQVEDQFYHSALGLDDNGNLLLIAMHGSLAAVGQALAERGAVRGIMMDQGGSVGYALWSKSTGNAHHYIGTGSYWRDRCHALLVVLLKEEFIEPPFREADFDPQEIPAKDEGREPPAHPANIFIDQTTADMRFRETENCQESSAEPFRHAAQIQFWHPSVVARAELWSLGL
jgi:hypothetical protein